MELYGRKLCHGRITLRQKPVIKRSVSRLTIDGDVSDEPILPENLTNDDNSCLVRAAYRKDNIDR